MSLRGDPPRWARHLPLAQAWTQSCLCLEPHDLSIVHAWLPLRSSLWHNLMAAQSAVASQAWTLGDSSPALTTVCARFPTRKATAQCPSARLGCLKGPSQSPIAGPGGRLCGLLPSLQKSSRRQCPAHKFSSASQQKHPPHPYDISRQALPLQRCYPWAQPPLAYQATRAKENGESPALCPS